MFVSANCNPSVAEHLFQFANKCHPYVGKILSLSDENNDYSRGCWGFQHLNRLRKDFPFLFIFLPSLLIPLLASAFSTSVTITSWGFVASSDNRFVHLQYIKISEQITSKTSKSAEFRFNQGFNLFPSLHVRFDHFTPPDHDLSDP